MTLIRANLNKSYFTDRQDRYIYFRPSSSPVTSVTSKGTACLAQYCYDFLQATSSFSFHLRPGNVIDSRYPYSYYQDGYTVYWPDAETHPHHIHHKVEKAFRTLQDEYRDQTQRSFLAPTEAGGAVGDAEEGEQVRIFPIIQAGQFGIREEEETMSALITSLADRQHPAFAPSVTSLSSPSSLSYDSSVSSEKSASDASTAHSVSSFPLLDLTSGYFALYEPYQDLILAAPDIGVRIVAAAPKVCPFLEFSFRVPMLTVFH
jgi:CDP-diacylglycerol---glycerol-3-phosphate 3-phosphatidyltransferase